MTVGNGAYMDVELQYRRDAGDLQTMTRTMDAGGQYSYCLAHEDSGQYTFLKIRNALNTAWVELDPAVTYTIRPPQPTSLTITPSTIQAGSGSFRMTVGNGADITLDYRYTLNGGTEREYIGWPSLEPVSEGQQHGAGRCRYRAVHGGGQLCFHQHPQHAQHAVGERQHTDPSHVVAAARGDAGQSFLGAQGNFGGGDPHGVQPVRSPPLDLRCRDHL